MSKGPAGPNSKLNIATLPLKDIAAYIADNYGLANSLLALANHCDRRAQDHDQSTLQGKYAYEEWQTCGRAIGLVAENADIDAMSDGAPCGLDD